MHASTSPDPGDAPSPSPQPDGARTDLDARYGRTPARRARMHVLAVLGVVGVLAVTVLWSVWAGLGQSSASLETHDIGHDAQDAHHSIIQFSVTVEPGTPVRCAVQALDTSYGTVGWVEVDLPAADVWTTEHSVEVLTSAQAVSGQAYRCWLVEG